MTGKIKLRPLVIEDLDSIMKWVNDEEIIGNFANFSEISKSEERKFIKNLIKSDNNKVFSIEDENGDYIGQAGINQIHWPSKVGRLSIIIGNKEKWGKGYAQISLKELIKIAFEKYNLHKLWIITFESNLRMQHIMSKLGFKKEGILIEEYYNKKKYHNVIRFALLDKEYFVKEEENV